jgi:hypothetical protein
MRGVKRSGVCDARMAVIEESEGEKREESTATSGGSLLSGGRGGVGVGSVPRGGRRRSGEGGGCDATRAGTAWVRWLRAARKAVGSTCRAGVAGAL